MNLDPIYLAQLVLDNLGYVFVAFFLSLLLGWYLGIYIDYLDTIDARER